jgi:hypothetical protein
VGLVTVATLSVTGCVVGLLPMAQDNDMDWQLRHGTVTGKVVGLDGVKAGRHEFLFGAANEGCGIGDVGYGPQPDGTFEIPCLTGRQVIQLIDYGDPDNPLLVGEQEAVVLPATTINITIQLHEPRPLRAGG